MHNDPRSVDSWMSHVNGALALVKLRSLDKFHEPFGFQLLTWLSTHILISCVAATTRIPPGLIQLRSDLETIAGWHNPEWQVSGLMIKYADLLCDVNEGLIPKTEVSDRILNLDREFGELGESMPQGWRYTTENLAKPCRRALETYFDIYPDHAVTQTWNLLRVMRILLANVVRDQSAGTDDLVDGLAKEICASAHQYTCFNGAPNTMQFNLQEKASCYTLIFPLYVAAVYADQSSGLRPWVMKQLSFLSEAVEIRQARRVVDILSNGDDPDPWTIYSMLGSYAFAV
ncbi:MAG: hypothetical protein Q9216_005897 [Gyalolechia sp. 2 TL-2023]